MPSKPARRGKNKNYSLTEATKKRGSAWRAKFLSALAASPSVTAAAAAAGVNRQYAYATRKEDVEFAAAWDDALEQAADKAEGELYTRGVKGWNEPVFQGGDEVGTVRKYSDTLLLAYLKARRREYRDQRNAIINIDWDQLTDEQITRIADGEDPVSVLTNAGKGPGRGA